MLLSALLERFSGQGREGSVSPPKRVIWSWVIGCDNAGSKVLIPPGRPTSPSSKSTRWSNANDSTNFFQRFIGIALSVSRITSARASMAYPCTSSARPE
eukprot:Skav221110  [mRNA]  locus=scaffold233:72960:73256:- [translate_table: standard]